MIRKMRLSEWCEGRTDLWLEINLQADVTDKEYAVRSTDRSPFPRDPVKHQLQVQ